MQSESIPTEDVPATEASGIESLGELLQDHDAGVSEGGPRGSDEESAPKKFNDLAEKLGIELDALYQLEVSQADDGTPVTVETLKDYYAKQGDVSLREIEFEERKTQQEAELLQAQQELQELMAALPEKAIKPEVLQKVREKHDAQLQLERRRTLDVIPEWQDEKTRTADIEGMLEHLKQYGYPLTYLQSVTDHRQLKYIRDNWKREQRIRQALAQVKAGKPNPTTRQKAASKAPSKRPLAGVERGNAMSKLEAVFSQLD